jgi:thymidylate synthase
MRPFVNIEADSFRTAFEQLNVRVHEKGVWGRKESYQLNTKWDKIFEVESRVAISDILQQPMISMAYPVVYWSKLPGYVEDVLLGTKDYFIGAQGYDYTYPDRINRRVGGPGGQLAYVVRKLGEAEGSSNRAQFTTWVPEVDSKLGGPPCLQRGWFKVEDDTLHMETDWRSRDLYGAWGENVFGMMGIAVLVKDCLEDYFGMKLSPTIAYVDKCNSLHVYENRFREWESIPKTIKLKDGRVTAFDTTDPNFVEKYFGGKELFWAAKEAKKTVYDPVFQREKEKRLKALEKKE